jgi:hypothetical protein
MSQKDESTVHTQRPLGKLTYAEADRYFNEFCELMQSNVAMVDKESRLPASFEVMKEALMVQALAWWQGGMDFDETAKHMATGLIHLCSFLPDELVDTSLVFTAEGRERMERMVLNGDGAGLDAAKRAQTAADELQDLRIQRANAGWNQFIGMYRKVYGKT